MKWLLVLLALFIPTATLAQSAPKCLFVNIPDGPAIGGEGGNGTYLFIYGHNFGSSQGTSTVTVNGTPVAQYLVWGSNNSQTTNQDMIGVQIAAATTGTGNIVVTTSAGSCGTATGNGSFPLPFTVTTGHKILYIGNAIDNTTISCSTGGTFTSPWGMANSAGSRTPYSYYNSCMTNGDTLVFLNGASFPFSDGRGWSASMTIDKSGGTATNFINIMARPGATVTIGGQQGYGMRGTGAGGFTHYTGLTAIGKSDSGMAMNNNDVMIGNIIECPTCGGEAGAIDGSSGGGQGQSVLGNWITNVSLPGPSNKQYHDAYMSGNNWEFAWNKISGGSAYNGLQINEDSTTGWHNLTVHDNEFIGANGSCVTYVTVNPNAGYVEGYNNVLHNCGVQQASDGSSDTPHNGMSSKASATSTAAGSIEWWNNTLFNTSVELNTSSGCGNECGLYQIASGQTGLNVDLRNNANMLPAYAHAGSVNCYFADDNSPGPFTGSNNFFFSVTTCGSSTGVSTVGSLTNPVFANPSEGPWQNFIPASGSPMIGAGAALPANVHALGQSVPLTWDFQGLTVNPSAPQIGALAFTTSAPTFTLSCTNAGSGTGTITGSSCNAPYTAGQSYSFTATANSGSTFISWASSPSCGGTATGNVYAGTMPAAACTITATFNAATTFTLSTTTSGAGTGTVTGATCAGTRAAGAAFSCAATAGTGSTFGVWTSSPSCGGTASGTTYSGSMPALNCNVNASFTLNSYALTTATSGTGAGTVSGCAGSVNFGAAYSCTATPSAGSTFTSWSSTCGGTATGSTYHGNMPASACSVTATFTLIPMFTLTTATTGTGTGNVTGSSCAGSRVAGASYSCTAIANGGSTFISWSSTCGGTASGNVYSGTMPSSNCTVTATFNLSPTFTLTTATAGSGTGTVTGVNCAGTYPAGTAYSCTATATGGSVFGSFSSTCGGSASGNVYSGTMPASNCTVTATFNPPSSFTLSTATSGSGSGTVNGASCAGTYTAGTAYSCTANPLTGSTFTSWSSTCGGTASGATYSGTMPSSNCSVTATFTLSSFTLTCSTAGSGSGTIGGSTCNTTYNFGASYSFTATANGGSTFASWSSSPSCSGTASGNIYSGTMPSAACTLTANFNIVTPGKGSSGGNGIWGGKGTIGP